MKIIFLNDDYPPRSKGGAAVVVERLALQFQRLGHHVTIITTNRHKESKYTHQGLSVYSLHVQYPLRYQAYVSLYNPSVISQLNQLLSQLQPDVINAHNLHAYLSYHSLAIARKHTAKLIFTGHDTMPFFYGRLTNFIDADHDCIPDTLDLNPHFLSQAWKNKLHFNPFRNIVVKHYLTTYPQHLVVVSKLLQQLYQQNGLCHTKVIYNGIDLKNWAKNTSSISSFINKYHLHTSHKHLLLVGRIRKHKGAHQLLQILPLLPQHTRLLLAGPQDDGLQGFLSQAKAHQLSRRVKNLGNLNHQQLSVAYHFSDVVCIPSMCFDSFPNVATEAIATKTPLVISQYCGTAELLKHNHSALIVNPFDTVSLTHSLTQLLTRPSLTAKLATNAYHTISTKNLTLPAQAKKYLQLFS